MFWIDLFLYALDERVVTSRLLVLAACAVVIGYDCFDVHWISFVFLELSLVCFRRDSDKFV